MFRSPCTICTDLLTSEDLAACPCGHVYHNKCLETWFRRSRTCPTCRVACPLSIKLYFSDAQESVSNDDIHTVKNELRKQTALNLEKDAQIKALDKGANEARKLLENMKCVVQKCQEATDNEKAIKESLKKQVQFLTEKTKHVKMLEKNVVTLKSKVDRLERFETLLHGTQEEAEEMLNDIGTDSEIANELARQLVIMKRENGRMRDAKKKASADKAQLERDYNSLNHKLKTKELECGKLNKHIETLQEQLKETEQEKQNLKKKVDKMQQSFDTSSPRGTLINRLLHESPAPLAIDPQEKVTLSFEADENVEFTIGSSENQRPQVKKPRSDFISPVHPGALQKNRKRSYVSLENPGRLSSGYNGLGGHSTVLLPSQAKKIKKVSKPQTMSKFMRPKLANPSLPRM